MFLKAKTQFICINFPSFHWKLMDHLLTWYLQIFSKLIPTWQELINDNTRSVFSMNQQKYLWSWFYIEENTLFKQIESKETCNNIAPQTSYNCFTKIDNFSVCVHFMHCICHLVVNCLEFRKCNYQFRTKCCISCEGWTTVVEQKALQM